MFSSLSLINDSDFGAVGIGGALSSMKDSLAAVVWPFT